ncbi:MAG: CCA tRNA nucleotidyltransferase [Acidobacteria bacterium]|nr:CCA tRNA nucleotidyltransferase [Acidobacteriota bacterium]
MSRGSGDLFASLSLEARKLIAQALEFARRSRIDVYLVGGAVRDLSLGEEVYDLDLVWEGAGEPESVARAFGKVLQREVAYHPEFLTASLTGSDDVRVDLSRARSETYSAPAALPTVRPSGLRQDLMRRDFSINAMAVALERPRELIDPCGGAADLRQRLLRISHELSFRDDPTRILRGCELAVRRGFEFETGTGTLVEAAVREGYLALLSGPRVRHELARLLASSGRAAAGAKRLRALGIDRALHRQLRIDQQGVERLVRLAAWSPPGDQPAASDPMPFWIIALTALLWDRPSSERRAVARWLDLGRAEKRWLTQGPERLGRLLDPAMAVESDREAMAQIYTELSRAEIRVVELLSEPGHWQWLREIRRLSGIELQIGGGDLLAAGAAAGPRIGNALEATLAARRRGELQAAGELDFAVAWLSLAEPEEIEK